MRKSLIKTLTFLLIGFIYSCEVKDDGVTHRSSFKEKKIDKTQLNITQTAGFSFFLLDLPIRVGTKNDDGLLIDNLDTNNIVHVNGDTSISLSNFRLIHDTLFQTAYLNFKGVGSISDTTQGVFLYNYMIPLTIIDNLSSEIVTKPPRVEHTCRSWEAPLLDIIFGCNCCDMLWKDGLIIGCTCKCTWGICYYEKKIITDYPDDNPNYISSSIINNAIDK